MDKGFTSRILRGLVSTSFGSVVTIGFHFLSVLFLTRYAPKDVLGMYFLSLAVVALLTVIGGFGLDLTLSKFLAGGEKRLQQDAIASAFLMRFISLTFVGGVFYAAERFILPIFDARLSDYVVMMIVLSVMTSGRDLFLSLMRGTHKFGEYAVAEILSAASRVALLLIFRNQLNLRVLLSIEIAAQCAEVLLQFFFMRALLFGLSLSNIKTGAAREIAQFSAPLYSNNILALVFDRSGTFLVGALLNPASVAAFEVALKIPDGFMRLFHSFMIVYFPGLSSLFAAGDRDGARRMMNRSLVFLSTGVVFLVLAAFLFADEIIKALFSEAYLSVSLAFALLMLNFFLRAVSNVLGYSLVSAGHASAPVKTNAVASVVNIAGSLVMIRLFGYIGAVYSLLLMNATSLIIYELRLRRAGLAPHSLEYLKPVFLLIAALGAHEIFGAEGALSRLLLVGFYAAGSWLFIKEIKDASRAALKFVLGPGMRPGSALRAISRMYNDVFQR